MTPDKKIVAQAIVNCFESGTPEGRYDLVTLLPDDPGHLTYGRSQTTLGSGNLAILIEQYCNAKGAQFGERLKAYLPRLKAKDFTLDNDQRLRRLLRLAGKTDPVMQRVQDDFFDTTYWKPANDRAYAIGFDLPLSVAVVYDSTVHGSWDWMRRRTTAAFGSPAAIGEKEWIEKYLKTRRRWLATHSIEILRDTVYRMDTFLRLVEADNWQLDLPIIANGVTIR